MQTWHIYSLTFTHTYKHIHLHHTQLQVPSSRLHLDPARPCLRPHHRVPRLGLKEPQEREMVHVLVDCCLQEHPYNPFYAFLAARLCAHDRRLQVSVAPQLLASPNLPGGRCWVMLYLFSQSPDDLPVQLLGQVPGLGQLAKHKCV